MPCCVEIKESPVSDFDRPRDRLLGEDDGDRVRLAIEADRGPSCAHRGFLQHARDDEGGGVLIYDDAQVVPAGS